MPAGVKNARFFGNFFEGLKMKNSHFSGFSWWRWKAICVPNFKSLTHLEEFETKIARLVRNAYPSVDDDEYENLAVLQFLDGLRKRDTLQAFKLANYKTFTETLIQALEFETLRQSIQGHG
ncbi:hypothetical protein J6590_009010 [Homalodisca vitripennis]|nr:hypothetical protein J6590_009010 [Homalodisca vitripennis]